MSRSGTKCNCPPSSSHLPEKQRIAALNSQLEEVINWLNTKGWIFGIFGKGDVNAATAHGETLLGVACARGHTTLVEEFLRWEELHLNIKTDDGMTPLMMATKNGHVDCVHLLLDANHPKCKLDLTVRNNDGETALTIAAKYRQWDTMKLIMDSQPSLNSDQPHMALLYAAKYKEWEVLKTICQEKFAHHALKWREVMSLAVNEKQWDTVCVLLNRYRNETIEKRVLLQVVSNNEWDGLTCLLQNFRFTDDVFNIILEDLVFEQNWEGMKFMLENHSYSSRTLQYAFADVVHTQQWEGVELLLHKISKHATLNVELAQKALQGTEAVLQESFVTETHDSKTLNGTLLVAASGGASESTFRCLLQHHSTYHIHTLDTALLILVNKKYSQAGDSTP
ncbi:uncharacterized protein [Panulirus ornatus]|uniref:uncharacterized protein isoform X1 n=1 Tax=Panulirus ornatus TaxID=150431 RepID=UPI003A8A76B7